MTRIAVACALAAALMAVPAAAQGDPKAELAKLKPKDFPSQPIEYTVVYPAGGHAVVAIVQQLHGRDAPTFANLQGELFEVKLRDIAAMHLAAVDDQQ